MFMFINIFINIFCLLPFAYHCYSYLNDICFIANSFLGEMQRIAFRLMLSSCMCVCVCLCAFVSLCLCVYAAFVDARKKV